MVCWECEPFHLRQRIVVSDIQMYTASVDNADPEKMTEDELKDESVVEKRAVLGR